MVMDNHQFFFNHYLIFSFINRCASFEHIQDDDMKESSFRGMLRLITTNIGGISNDDFIFSFCKQVYSWLETYRHGEMLK